jgi:putative hydrolase of the HAD superfamily
MGTTFFLDIGGVLLTNGWDRNARQRAAEVFHLDIDDMNERHHLTFDTYEEGKLSLEDYLNRLVFYEPKPFSREDFKKFMFDQSQPFPQMIDMIKKLKARYHLSVGVISNEGRELTEYRIEKFKLSDFIDLFVSSCFVHLRKPDADIYRMALDIAQASPSESLYIEDRALFVNVATGLGIPSILHTDYESTQKALADLGFS